MDETPNSWLYILPLTLLVLFGFGFLAWQSIDDLPSFNFNKNSGPTLTDEEMEAGETIEIIYEDEQLTPQEQRRLEKAKRAAEALAEKQAAALARSLSTSTEEMEEIEEEEEDSGVALSQTVIDEIVTRHNNARNAVGVSALSWSSDIAQKAGIWAARLSQNGCKLNHSTTKYGENLYQSTETTINPEPALSAWLEEKAKYDELTKNCQIGQTCGHFTQMVWSGTTELGCGVAQCGEAGDDGQVWVCQYNPAGNVSGEVAY